MSGANREASIRRIVAIDEITAILQRHHPHLAQAGRLKLFVERQRIVHALRAEQARLDYLLIERTAPGTGAKSGVLVATPKAHAETAFAAYGPAPMLFGFLFGLDPYDSFRELFEDLLQIASEKGRANIVGPFEATINYSCGMQEIDFPFAPGFLMPQSPPAWNAHFNIFGFKPAERLLTFEAEMRLSSFKLFRSHVSPDFPMTLHPLEPPFSESEIGAIADIFNSGWRANWGFVPIDADFIRVMQREFAVLLWPHLSYIAHWKGQPAGVLIAIPDLNEVFRTEPPGRTLGELARAWRFFVRKRVRAVRVLILGLRPELQGTREGACLIEGMLDAGKTAAEGRYHATHVQLGWTLSSNRRVNKMVDYWSPTAQRVIHRMWQLDLRSGEAVP